MLKLNKIAKFTLMQTNLKRYTNLLSSFNIYPKGLYKPTARLFSEQDSHSDFKPKVKVEITDDNVVPMIDEWVKNNDCLLFMKGTREMPRCGFSNYIVQILNFYDIKNVKVVNILENPIIREAVKKYSNWPTYPQLYIKGNLVGTDILNK
jgi:monothiol glutaredoxin